MQMSIACVRAISPILIFSFLLISPFIRVAQAETPAGISEANATATSSAVNENKKRKVDPVLTRKGFSPESLGRLLDSYEKSGEKVEVVRPQPEDLAFSRVTASSAELTISEIDAFKRQMRRCWIPATDTPAGGSLIVSLKVFLNIDGSLAGPTEVVNKTRATAGDQHFRLAAASALRSIDRCQPFQMPPEKYQRWRIMLLTFDPREMLGR